LLVAGATLLGRRYGDRVAGLTAGLPIVAGPILFFYALEQGPAFAVQASLATLWGLISLSLFAAAYAWRAWLGGTALSSVILGWAVFALTTMVIQGVLDTRIPGLGRSLIYAAVALYLGLRSLPPSPEPLPRAAPGPRDLFWRMAAAVSLVLLLTYSAEALGPRLGGLLTPFPVASTVLAVFAHRQGGSEAAIAVLKGLLLALNAFAAFCTALVLALPRFGLIASFALALLAAAAVQALVLAWRRRRAVPKP
jgi:hypothetical protein